MRIRSRAVPVNRRPWQNRTSVGWLRCLLLARRLGAKRSGLALIGSLTSLLIVDHALGSDSSVAGTFPTAPASYQSTAGATLWQVLSERVRAQPFNLAATAIFLLAILHTFLAPKFKHLAHRYEREHRQRQARSRQSRDRNAPREEVSFRAVLFHFLGEVEVIFGIWVVPLLIALTIDQGWPVARDYVGHGLNFTEPLFVVVIMTMAASRPVLKFSEKSLAVIAWLGQGSPAAWWFTILTFAPLLGSFITEPAAMTIAALLLAEKVYACKPSVRLAYATLGLLFVNVSVGGTLTHFAAPPVLMVAGKWGWGLSFMFTHFGWKAAAGILAANLVYLAAFRRELMGLRLQPDAAGPGPAGLEAGAVPFWVTLVHGLFLLWTVVTSHYPALFIGGFLFYLAFHQATEHHQDEVRLRPALLVGFFLAGLIVHGGLQGWWIAPVLSGLREHSLFVAAGILTAFNDNAAITYLASLVPNLSASLQYAVVAGAVAGGGLTVIANAPNPAGQAILGTFFPEGVSAFKLLLGALVPTLLLAVVFLLF